MSKQNIPDDLQVGFVGLGDMGAPMAANIAKSGQPLTVFDINLQPERVPPSAVVAESLAQIAGNTDMAFVSVPDGAASMAVIKDLLRASDSRLQCLINLSTVGIADNQQLTDAIPDGAFEYVDAPVSGGQTGAVKGTLTVMWSGSKARFEELRPVLLCFAKSVFFVGENPGQGQALKLLNNFLSGVAMTATSEAVRFGLHHGIELKTLLDVVHVSTGQNTAVSDKFPNRILTETYDAGFRMELMAKDISLYHDSVTDAGLPSNIADQVAIYWRRGLAQYPDADFTEIFNTINATLIE